MSSIVHTRQKYKEITGNANADDVPVYAMKNVIKAYEKGRADGIDEFARLIHEDLYQLNHHQVDFLVDMLKLQTDTDEREIQNVLRFKEMVKEQKNE